MLSGVTEICVPGRVEPRQLALSLSHAESFTRDDFLEGPANAAGLALIDSWPDWPNRVMLLVGPEGSGKSHLAAIWAERSGARSTSAHALTAAEVPTALATGALVIEDLKSSDIDERALFHLLNLAREEDAFVLITARTPPAKIELRDLRSPSAVRPRDGQGAADVRPKVPRCSPDTLEIQGRGGILCHQRH